MINTSQLRRECSAIFLFPPNMTDVFRCEERDTNVGPMWGKPLQCPQDRGRRGGERQGSTFHSV